MIAAALWEGCDMIDVAVLAGGCSPEHDVSVSSVRKVLDHLSRDRYRVWPVLLDRDGTWWPARRPLARGEGMPSAPGEGGDALAWLRVPGAQPMRPGAALDHMLDRGLDVVLPILHGPFGEDGTVQGMLELHGVAFVGSGCAASAVAMDKIRTREVFEAHGIPMAKAWSGFLPGPRASVDAMVRDLMAAVGLPCFLKLDLSGSTLGVQCVRSRDEALAFVRAHRGQARRLIAEGLVEGEEITVGVLGNAGGPLEALPAIGIYPVHDGYFTHEAKYQPGFTDEVIPPRHALPEVLEEAARWALRCHEALVCDGMSRTDMIVTSRGIRVLETNTIPGMTEQSLLPQAAQAHGLSYAALLDRLIELAVAAHGQRRLPTTSVAARG